MDLLDKNERDAEAKELWGRLKPTIPSFFEGITIKPSLLHGDMWSGNVASIDGNPGTYFKLIKSVAVGIALSFHQ